MFRTKLNVGLAQKINNVRRATTKRVRWFHLRLLTDQIKHRLYFKLGETTTKLNFPDKKQYSDALTSVRVAGQDYCVCENPRSGSKSGKRAKYKIQLNLKNIYI